MSNPKTIHLNPNDTKPVLLIRCSCGSTYERYTCSCGALTMSLEREDGKVRNFALVIPNENFTVPVKGSSHACKKCGDVLTPY